MGTAFVVGVALTLTCSSKSGQNAATGGSGGAPAGTGGATTGGGGSGTGGATGGSAGAGTGGASGGGSGGNMGTGGTAGSMGTGGAAGSMGTGGSMATGGAGGGLPPPPGGASVLQRNRNPTRDGHFIAPQLTRANAARVTFQSGFNARFSGTMLASPLYVDSGPGGKGVFFAVTITNNVYALDETTGAVVWMKNVGTPAMKNGPNAPCGSIHPLGILATPVIDAASRTIFVSAGVGDANQILRQEIHALSIDDGSERPGWPVDASKAGGFDPQAANPRSALSLVNGILYVAYGGHLGDCGGYHGRVVAVDVKDPTKTGVWSSGGVMEGIWASGGMASDGNGIIATTGNGEVRTTHLDSEQVMRLRGMATLNRGVDDVFYPAEWSQMDLTDADFGASSPMIMDVPGASTIVVAPAKTGNVYFLDAKRLGGMGGQLARIALVSTAGGSIFTAPAGYTTAKGSFTALSAFRAVGCPAGSPPGGPGDRYIMGVKINPGPPLRPEVAWCAAIGQPHNPIVTTTDGRSEALVWFSQGSNITAVDGETGQVVISTTTGCESSPRDWTSPIVVKGRIVVAGAEKLCSWAAP